MGKSVGKVGRFFAINRIRLTVVPLVFLLFGTAQRSGAYSLLSHEQLIDIVWKDHLEGLILKRFPGTTPQQLHEAQAYAYGGSLIQDIGYYPFGKKFFSDLTHYVRTGDFVQNLVRDANTPDEYAFALGALSHYSSDCSGHPLINRTVGLAFPKLRAKYGPVVTYENSPRAHIQTEFGFDLTQVAKNRYTSDKYHDFIGFEVARPLLERAFFETYGLRLQEVIPDLGLAIGTFRRAASRVIPEMTRAALTVYHPELVKEIPNFSEKRFLYNLSRVQYEKEWGKDYQQPGFFTRALGWMLRWIPKVGPLKALAFKVPTPEMEDMYIKSMNKTVEKYRNHLREVSEATLEVADIDCDTDRPTALGEYTLADESYAKLLDELFARGYERVPPGVRESLLAFYNHPNPPRQTRKERESWERTVLQLEALRAGAGSPIEVAIRERLLHPKPELAALSSSKTFRSPRNPALSSRW